MRATRRNRRGGQVLVMVTLSLILICGMLGLVVDLGWAYFTKKAAQAAADAAALAAVQKALDGAVDITSYQCSGDNVACAATPVTCPGASRNLASACVYAAQLGFDPTADPRVQVTVQASDQGAPTVVEACGQGAVTIHHPPTTGCVDTYYWVTVRVQQSIPQLFSAVLGNTIGGASARATAGVAKTEAIGSLILLNRENDPWSPQGSPEPAGENLVVGGTPNVNVLGGILLASNAGGGTGAYAGVIQGGGTVTAPYTYIRTGGDTSVSNNGTWDKPPDNRPDGAYFLDPYRNVHGPNIGGQPPLKAGTDLPLIPVGNDGTLSCGTSCGSGVYYAVNGTVATGHPITINSPVAFDGGTFGEFYFFGGVRMGGATVTMGPGRYVFAGVKTKQQIDPVLEIDNGTTVLGSPSDGSDAGRVLILTDSNYTGLEGYVSRIQGTPGITMDWDGTGKNQLGFSYTSIQAGSTPRSSIALKGLNETSPNLPDNLKDFALSPVDGQGAGVIFWQDQANSFVKYTDGHVDTSCGSMSDFCPSGIPTTSSSPGFEFWATPDAGYQGVIYQPRGAWAVLQARGTSQGAIRIVTGALKTQGSGVLNIAGVSSPIVSYGVALLE